MRDVIPNLPRSLNAYIFIATVPPAPFVPVEHQFKTGPQLLLAGFGDPAEHQKIVEHIRVTEPPLFDLVTTMPYVELQGMFNEEAAWGFYGYQKNAYYEDITDEMIEILSTKGLEMNSPLSHIEFDRLMRPSPRSARTTQPSVADGPLATSWTSLALVPRQSNCPRNAIGYVPSSTHCDRTCSVAAPTSTVLQNKTTLGSGRPTAPSLIVCK